MMKLRRLRLHQIKRMVTNMKQFGNHKLTNLNDLEKKITFDKSSTADVVEKQVKRLITIDGKFPAHFKDNVIGQTVKVKLSSMMIGVVINPLNNQEIEMATIDIVDENGEKINWEFTDIFV